jgi:hypothetical protein
MCEFEKRRKRSQEDKRTENLQSSFCDVIEDAEDAFGECLDVSTIVARLGFRRLM